MSGLEGLLAGRALVKRYRIEEVIGRGGFAVVYRATDEKLGRPVAVKIITLAAPDPATRELLRERFQREARAAASLQHHPNVVTVHDFGRDPELELDFLVMELLRGEDLATHLKRAGRPPLEGALGILRDAAEGLAVGHRAGLIHRDMKPGNIFLAEPHGDDPFRVCVLDFGIARVATDDRTLTRADQGGSPLSPAYASPEQLRGEDGLTPASDVFSLGVVGYQLLTGEKPFRGERRRGAEGWRVEPGIREANPEVPPEVEAVVLRALAHDPGERFPDAAAFGRALDAASGEGERTAPAPAAVVPVPLAADALDADDRTVLQAAPPPPRGPVRAAPPPRRAPERSGFRSWPLALLAVLLAALGAWWVLGSGGDGGAREGVEEPPPVVVTEGEAVEELDAGDGDGEEAPPREAEAGEPEQAAPAPAPRPAESAERPAVVGVPAPSAGAQQPVVQQPAAQTPQPARSQPQPPPEQTAQPAQPAPQPPPPADTARPEPLPELKPVVRPPPPPP